MRASKVSCNLFTLISLCSSIFSNCFVTETLRGLHTLENRKRGCVQQTFRMRKAMTCSRDEYD